MTDTSFLIANAQIVGFPIVYVSDHFSRLVGHRCLFGSFVLALVERKFLHG